MGFVVWVSRVRRVRLIVVRVLCGVVVGVAGLGRRFLRVLGIVLV